MKFENAVYPNKEQIKGFTEGDHAKPISMVNLLKFKEKAEYADGRETELTGAEAYAIYGQGVSKLVAELGGEIVFAGIVERLALGEIEELWDQVAIAKYPNRKAIAYGDQNVPRLDLYRVRFKHTDVWNDYDGSPKD